MKLTKTKKPTRSSFLPHDPTQHSPGVDCARMCGESFPVSGIRPATAKYRLVIYHAIRASFDSQSEKVGADIF